jgi:hypothetical protein
MHSTRFNYFSFWGVGCKDGISLFLWSQGFEWVSMMFFKFPMWSSRVFPITFHFISYPMLKVLFFHQKGETKGKHSIFIGELFKFWFFFGWWANQNVLLQRKTHINFLICFEVHWWFLWNFSSISFFDTKKVCQLNMWQLNFFGCMQLGIFPYRLMVCLSRYLFKFPMNFLICFE